MSVILPQIPARLRRMLGRFVGPAGAALFSLVLASCAGGGFGGAPDTPAVNPASQPAPATSGPISPASQRNVAEALSGLKLGDEAPPISPEDIAVSDDAEILNRNPFSSPAPAARASGWGARADSTRKTQGYKAFEVAVPSENPLMTVAVWISETPPDYPEGKPEQDPESDRKFLYLRLQVFIEVEHVALVEGGGVEVLDSEVIVVEEKRPDPKPQPKPQPVTLEAVTAETVCESGSLSANGQTQAQLDSGLLSAARDNDLEGACEYLRRGANVEAQESEWRYYKRTALMIAATDGHLDLAKLLRTNGADVNRQGGNYHNDWDSPPPTSGNRRMSALHYASGAGHKDFVEWLLAEGADLSAQQTGKRDALWEAAFWGRVDIVKLFLSLGADVNVRDVAGATPFLDAVHHSTYWARYGNQGWGISDGYAQPLDSDWATVISLLVSHGTDVNARYRYNHAGYSALDIAVSRGNAGSAEVLRGYGVRCFVQTGPLCGEVQVAVDFSSSGAGTVSAEGDGGALSDGDDVRQGATVMFTATPAAGHYVSGWSGNCAEIGDVADGLDGTAKSCAVSAASDLSVRAEFSEIPSLAGPLCESGSLSANGLTQAQLNAGLISAAEGNDLPGACEYLRRGANVDARESGRYYKRTALMIAANDGFLDLAKLLHANGADVNLYGGTHDGNFYGRDRRGYPALHYAGVAGHPELVGWLLDSGAELNSEWESGKTALWDAAYWGRPDVVELLLSRGAETETYYNGGATPLHAAVMLEGVSARRYWANGPAFRYKQMALAYSYPTPTADEHGQVVSLLLSHDAEVNARYQFRSDSGGRSPLDYAARQGDERLSAMLRDAGGICFVETGPLCPVVTAVTTAVTIVASTVVTAETICESGSLSANGLTQAQLDSGLLSAARDNDLEGACEYLRRGANVEAQESEWRYHKRTALMIAATDGYLDLAKLLRANGADVNRQGGNYHNSQDSAAPSNGNRRMSALHYASGAGHKDFVEWLLAEGADLHAKQTIKRDALWEAAFWGRVDIVKLFLSLGANVNARDVANGTPFLDTAHHSTYWARYGNQGWGVSDGYAQPLDSDWATVISLLVSHGTDVNARYTSGYSALDVAVSRGNAGSAEVLRGYGVRCFVETGPLCGVPEVVTAVTMAVTLEAVTSETVCESGSLSANGLTQAQLDSGLLSAARDNDLEGACEHLRRGANVEAQESEWRYHKRTALMIAATDGYLDLAKLLRANGADVNRQGGNYHNSQDSAAPSNGNRRMSALHYASGAGHKDFVEWLLAEGADLHAKQTIKRDALWEAAFWGRVDIVKLFLSLGANVNARDVANGTPFLDTAHHSTYWARYGNQGWGVSDGYAQPLDSDWATVISLLVSHGTDVNARYTSGYSALDVAVSRGNAEYAEVLRGYGVRCFVRTGPLCGVPDVAVEYAVIPADESGGTVSAEGDDGVLSHEDEVRQGTTLTFTATPALGWMLSAWGGDAADCSGFVCALAANSDLSVHAEFSPILSLTDLSCPAGTLPTNGLTAAELNMTLRMASRGGDATRVCEALRRGAEVNDNLDDSEFTPLQEAVSGGHLEAVKVLLANGAEVNKRKDGAGHSPLDLAARDGEAEIAALLRNANGRCFVETGPLCRTVPVATPDPVTVVNTVAATVVATVANTVVAEVENTVASTVAAGSCPAGTLPINGMTQAQLDAGLLSAASSGDLAEACEHLRRGANPNGRDQYEHVPLMRASSQADLEMGKLLLDNGADLTVVWVTGGRWTPLFAQYNGGYASARLAAQIEFYLSRGVDPNLGSSAWNPLHEAAYYNEWRSMKLLLDAGADPNIQTTRSGWRGGAPLHYVFDGTRSGSALAVSVLVAGDADVNLRDNYGRSALDLAANRGDAASAEILRAAGGQCFVSTRSLCEVVPVATPNPVTVVNTVAATVANTIVATVANTVVAAVENTVAATVAAGSCPAGTLPTNGMTQAQLDDGFLGAALENDVEEICEYLRRGANIEIRTDQVGRPHHTTALMIAGRNNYLDLARLLLSNGADVDSTGDLAGGWPALHYAAYAGHADVARVFLDAGANPDVGLEHFPSWKPLHEAAYYNNWRIMKVLLTSGANPNIQTARTGWRGGAPLHYVFDGTRSGSALAVSVLVAGDAEVNLRDSGGNSALDLAANRGDAASAEILRAAGGQCFVSTSSLCGSAPAPAAAAAESAPATDRLRESFAGAFNPSPAFGDAFGAASGSSERFLSRLDSLMRSTSGSGGNAWDSFAGWQRENEHGRMWFSTGQRGDFGFGAGVGGAGGDLSASPFAAMVGNGMLAGGETGLGAAGKLRIAAFADYQARSLLDGTDRQWTKWAASGTAIETAMTEAERFSGLAENQTRGAMTEIHLGGGDLGVALQAGAVSESDAMLSGTADDEHLRGLRARTAFAGLSGAADLFGSGWRLRGSAHLGRSWAESERMLRDGDLWASAFSAGLERGGWLYSDDGFILRFSQPLRVESLEMDLIGADGASRLGADPSGRQLDVDAAYRLPLSGGGWLLLSAGVRRDGGHTSSSDLEAGALFSVERGF